MNELIHLVLYLGIAIPSVNYVGYDDKTNVTRYVSSEICQTIKFESVIRTNGVFVLQISQNIINGWETFGEPIIGPTVGTNYQTWSVPRGEGYFRLIQKNKK